MQGLVVPMTLFTLLYVALGLVVIALIRSLVRETAPRESTRHDDVARRRVRS